MLAIANTKDQKRLAKLAIEDPDGTNRMIATHTLTDQKLLAKVAGESKREEVRVTAVLRLTGEDQPSLLKLIEVTQDSRVRGPAIVLVKDPALRAKLKADEQTREHRLDDGVARVGQPLHRMPYTAPAGSAVSDGKPKAIVFPMPAAVAETIGELRVATLLRFVELKLAPAEEC